MIIDTSALIAILSNGPEAPELAKAIQDASTRCLPAASFLETAIVIESRYGAAGGQKLDQLILTAQIIIEPVTTQQASLARLAFRSFGKGRHVAGLNFGDCFSYALAQVTAEPLLFKGDDFSKTDIPSVIS